MQDHDSEAKITGAGTGRAYRQLSVLVFGVYLLISGISLFQFRSHPGFSYPLLDEKSYVSWAVEILGRGPWGKEVFYQDPLYPYFLAAIFALAGPSLLLVRILQVSLGAASIAIVQSSVRRSLGRTPALISAVLFALCHALYFFNILVLKASLVVMLSALSCAIGVAAASEPKVRWRWFALGGTLALLTLLRGNFLIVVPFVVLWSLFLASPEPARPRIVRTLLLLAGLLAGLLPVMVRNYAVGGELVVSTSQGGANFYIGNNPLATGTYTIFPFVRPNPKWEAADFKREAERRAQRRLTAAQVSRFWFSEGLRWNYENPGKALRLLLHKFRLMFHSFEVPDNYDFALLRKEFVPVLRIPFIGIGLLWGPALLGMWLLCRRDRRFFYPAIFFVAYAISIVPFYIMDRYRVAVIPPAIMFAGAFLHWLAGRVRARDVAAAGAAAAVIATTLLISYGPIREQTILVPAMYEAVITGHLLNREPGKALAWAERTTRMFPGSKNVAELRSLAQELAARVDQARAISQAALVSGRSAEELLVLAGSLDREGQEKYALLILERAREQDPGSAAVLYAMADIYLKHQFFLNYRKALACIEGAENLDSDRSRVLTYYGRYFLAHGDTEKAATFFEKAVGTTPVFAPARDFLASLRAASTDVR